MQRDQLVNAAHLSNCTALYIVDQKGPVAQAISKPMARKSLGCVMHKEKGKFCAWYFMSNKFSH